MKTRFLTLFCLIATLLICSNLAKAQPALPGAPTLPKGCRLLGEEPPWHYDLNGDGYADYDDFLEWQSWQSERERREKLECDEEETRD